MNRTLTEFSLFMSYLFFLVPVLASFHNCRSLKLLVAATIILCIIRRFPYSKIIYIVLIVFVPSVSLFLTTVFTKGSGEILFSYGAINIYQSSFDQSLMLIIRSVSLSYLSIVFFISIDFSKLIYQLMACFHLSSRVGFSILAAANSFPFLLSEYKRIRTVSRMKGVRKHIFLPVLVSASRYAAQLSLSMRSRSLSGKRSFRKNYVVTFGDFLLIALNFAAVAAIIYME